MNAYDISSKTEDAIKYCPHINDFLKILNEAVTLRTNATLHCVRRLFEDDYDGFTMNSEYKSRAAFALAAWREQGIDTLVEAAKDWPSNKNYSIALRTLVHISYGEYLENVIFFPKFSQDIISEIQSDAVREYAYRKLNEFLIDIPDDDVALAVSVTLQHLYSQEVEGEKTSILLGACSKRWLAVSNPVLSEYENLLSCHPHKEGVFQDFLQKYPQMLDPMAVEVCPKPDFHGIFEPDFVIKRFDNTYLVVEIETPGKKIVTQGGRLSFGVTYAEQQVNDYLRFIRENRYSLDKHFPQIDSPSGLVVIGLEGILDSRGKKVLADANHSRHGVIIHGFDYLLERGRSVMENVISGKINSRPNVRLM